MTPTGSADDIAGCAASAIRPPRRTKLVSAAAALAALCLASPARAAGPSSAQPAPDVSTATPNPDAGATTATPAGIAAAAASPAPNIDQRTTLLGDMGGLRTLLGDYGITFNLSEIDEVLGNVTGGRTQEVAYDGLTTASIQVDSKAAFGYDGGSFNVSALQYHGRNLSADTLLNLQTASGIEADRATRLWELWYQQKLFGGMMDVRVGQQSLDQEFIGSTNAALFINTAFGWPLVPSYDLPGGGPAYPLSALGVRVRVVPTPGITVLAGVYNGSPARADCVGDAQRCNPSGTSFPLDGDQLIIGEVQYSFPVQGDLVTPSHQGLLPGTYRLGFWVDTESFADQRYDTAGLSLADPASDGTPLQHHDNWSVYGTMDQAVWQAPGSGAESLNLFVRAMGSPSDRNLISLSVNVGFVLKAPLPQRDADSAGLALGYGEISSSARGLDRDTQQFTGTGLTGSGFARSDESFIEATYQYVPFPWLQVQPDMQYVFNPGGGIADPDDPIHKIRNEAIFGLRTNIIF